MTNYEPVVSNSEKAVVADRILTSLVCKFGFREFSFSTKPLVPVEVKMVCQPVRKTNDGLTLYKILQCPMEVCNYYRQFCHWVLHYLSMDDTAKEGDIDRLIANFVHNIPFFSHSKLSHYLTENLDLILKTQHILSEQQSLRVLEMSFLNTKRERGIVLNLI